MGLEELKTELEENLNQYSLEEIELFCNLKRDDIWLDLKEKEILYFYHQFSEGKRSQNNRNYGVYSDRQHRGILLLYLLLKT